MPDYFENEEQFEDAPIESLTSISNQWECNVLEYKTEKELIENWKNIIFDRKGRWVIL